MENSGWTVSVICRMSASRSVSTPAPESVASAALLVARIAANAPRGEQTAAQTSDERLPRGQPAPLAMWHGVPRQFASCPSSPCRARSVLATSDVLHCTPPLYCEQAATTPTSVRPAVVRRRLLPADAEMRSASVFRHRPLETGLTLHDQPPARSRRTGDRYPAVESQVDRFDRCNCRIQRWIQASNILKRSAQLSRRS